MFQRKRDRQAGDGMVATVLMIVRASHCKELEVSDNQYDSAGRNICIQQGTWLIENRKGTQEPCLAPGQSAPSFHTGSIV